MKKPLAIGIEDYREMIDQNYYYVDKTLLLKEILDKKGKVNLFTRPRRFGKTLALSTIKTFFEKAYTRAGEPVDYSRYFQGMKIMEAGEDYVSHLGQYPVISFSLKSGKQPNYEMAYESLIDEIAKEYDRHNYVLKSENLTEAEKRQFIAVRDKEAKAIEYAKSLEFLSRCLEKAEQSKVIILIDEYDVPLENAYSRGFYNEMIDFIRSVFGSALKTNDSLYFAVITGCLRISKESIFTGINNFQIISILSATYAEYYGFVQQEVDDMLAYYELTEKREELRRWYDGYLFGETEVYNPWSMVNYVYGAAMDGQKYPKPYWSNTSSNSIIRELVDEADQETRQQIEDLMAGGSIEIAIHEEITYDDIHETKENIWNFLFFTGYLKMDGKRFEDKINYVTLKIPNEEISYIYENTILKWFDKKIRKADLTPLSRAIDQGDAKAFEDFLSMQLMDTISFFDYEEGYYHGFLIGLLKAVGTYQVESNRESGTGRPDIIMREYKFRGKSVLIEVKVAKEFAEMEAKCEEALEQIRDKDCDHELLKDGYQPPVKFGVCFFKKGCMVIREL